jgi:hypothetical protein
MSCFESTFAHCDALVPRVGDQTLTCTSTRVRRILNLRGIWRSSAYSRRRIYERLQVAQFWFSLSTILKRTQLLVVGFFVLVWIALVAILVLAPEIYSQNLSEDGGDSLAIGATFLIALSLLIAFLVVGVFRRWRWTFWLVLIASSLACCACQLSHCSSPG